MGEEEGGSTGLSEAAQRSISMIMPKLLYEPKKYQFAILTLLAKKEEGDNILKAHQRNTLTTYSKYNGIAEHTMNENDSALFSDMQFTRSDEQ